MATLEQTEAEINKHFGFMPPFFQVAQQTPDLLDHLWQQTLFAHIKNPLPLLFKEKLIAYLSRFCYVNYCIVCHSCALRPLGMSGSEILALLSMPVPNEADLITHLATLKNVPIQNKWPEHQSELEQIFFACTVILYLKPTVAKSCREEMRRVLKAPNFNHLSSFLSYVKGHLMWAENHPDLSYHDDKRAQDHLQPLLVEAPTLQNFFNNYANRDEYSSPQHTRESDFFENQFLSIASHELRTPLTSIKGFAQILQRNLTLAKNITATETNSIEQASAKPPLDLEKASRLVTNIVQQSNRLIGLIEEMLDISRINTGQFSLKNVTSLNLVKTMRSIVEQQHDLNPTHPLTFASEQPDIMVKADEGHLEQVLTNLINNAFKYSASGKPVEVGVQYAIDASGMVVGWVRDEGRGIPTTQQARIFEQFYRIRNDDEQQHEGLGIGLYISCEIIKQHGGRMWLKSELGVGSTFYFSLPAD